MKFGVISAIAHDRVHIAAGFMSSDWDGHVLTAASSCLSTWKVG